jgi:hypothetical protein
MKPQKLSETQVQNTVRRAIEDAVSFIEDEIAPARIKAAKYFDGHVNVPHEEGRSKVVATKCRDAVRAIKPVLMRIFLQSEHPVEFVPRRPDAVQAAEEATSYVRWLFETNDGFQKLMDVIHDALVKKVGIIKPYFEQETEAEYEEYSNLTDEELQFVQQDGGEIIEWDQAEDGTYSVKLMKQDATGKVKFDAIAPEDFFVDRNATCVDDAYVIGHRAELRVGDVVKMGFKFDEVFKYSGDTSEDDEEELERKLWDMDDAENGNDPSMRPVLVTEAYMRMDIDGTGIPQRHKFLCLGKSYHIIDRELSGHRPFAIFEVDPEPHTFFGRSLVDLLMDDQDASTALLRGLLDGLYFINNPQVEVDTSNVEDINDLLNKEIGGIVRKKRADQAVFPIITGAEAVSGALPAIQYYDETIRAKSGVLGAAMGMDADALQGNTATGVDAAVQAATAQAEMYARTLAEGGFTELFEAMAELVRANPQRDDMMRINGRFVAVDPSSWGTSMDCRANVGLGTNRHEERMMAMSLIKQDADQIFANFGPQNGIVSMTNLRNIRADLAKLAGIHNVDRYYLPMDEEREQQLLEAQAQAQAQQSQQSDPNAAFLQAEQMKVQQKAQADQQKNQLEREKAQAQVNLKASEIAMRHGIEAEKIDMQRDKMAQDRVMESAKALGQFGLQVDQNAIRREQQASRPV